MQGKLVIIEGIDGSGKTVQSHLLVERLVKKGYQAKMADFPQYGKSFFANMIERYLKGEFGWPQELKDHLKKYHLPSESVNIISPSGIQPEKPIVANSEEENEPKPEEVNPYLSSLLYAGDRWEMKGQMNKWIDEGVIIISNRYTCSNMAHQGAKIRDTKERNIFFEWIEDLEYKVYAIPKPDMVIYLHVPIEVSQELIKVKIKGERGFKSKIDMHELDVDYLKRVQDVYIDIAQKDNSWVTIDCSKNNQILTKEEIAEKLWNVISKILN